MNIKTLIPFTLSVRIVLGILLLVILYHLLIMSGTIPYQYVWGGRLESKAQMLQFELFSLLLNILMVLATRIRGGRMFVEWQNHLAIRMTMWLFALLFFFNTLGNLMALNSLETYLFTPITAAMCILFVRLGLGDSEV